MPSTEKDRIARVMKLQDKAGAFGVTSAEAETLTAKAAELMARHGITKMMVDKARADAAPVRPGDKLIRFVPPFHNQQKDMLMRLGDAMGLHPLWHKMPPSPANRGKYRYELAVELFGAPADIENCHDLFEWLMAQAKALFRTELPGGAKSAYKQSWLNGFSAAVSARVRAEYAKAAYTYDTEHALTGAKSSALVLKAWSDQVLEYRDAKYPHLVQDKPRKSSGNGYWDGYAAGERASLGKKSISSSGQKELAAAG